jgi:hypothetical protein
MNHLENTAFVDFISTATAVGVERISQMLPLPTIHLITVILSLTIIVPALLPGRLAFADSAIPPTWSITSENFENGSLTAWQTATPANLSLIAGGGHNGSTGLSVTINPAAAYVYQSHVGYAVEGYLSFWLNPNGVVLPEPSPNYWPPGTSLSVADVRSSAGDWWPPLIGFYLRQPTGQGYKGYLAWSKGSDYFRDYENGQFDLANGWQKITLGYHVNSWVAVWVNDVLIHHYTTDVVSADPSGDVIELGKVNENSGVTPSGSIRLDEVTFQVPRVADVWVNANSGNDGNNGLTPATAFRTIQKAANIAGPGTTVHILPGVYRETVLPILDGTAAEPVTYQAENGPGTVVIRGSEPSSSLTWTPLTANTIGLPAGVDPTKLYYTDLSGWNLSEPPRFVVQLNASGQVSARLPLAREPDWQVATAWKTHEFWWAADGGSSPAACDPATNSDHDCDLPQRSTTQLTDRTNDTQPGGIEAGNLTTLGDLTGATLVAVDTLQGHYIYHRTITAHDVAAGRITVDRICEHDGGTGNPGLGWGTKYYIEGKPRLLDNPGEWWYDAATKRLYVWPPASGNPSTLNIEISRREDGFSLENRSYTILDGLTIEFVNGSAVYDGNWTTQESYHNTVRNATLRYANWGVYLEQDVSASAPPGNVLDGFILENSEIAYMDTLGIRLIDWWENNAAADSFTHSGVLNTVIRNNEFHHLGFRSDDDTAVGLSFGFANKLRFENNHVHDIAHNGVQFSRSVIQSPKTYGFAPSEIKTGDILIKDNVIERACQLGTDCGGLKFWGAAPDSHVFRNVLITGNVFRDTFGWSYISEKRGRYTSGTSSQVRGMGGYGLFVDHASGLHAYRNIAYNNAYAGYVLYGVFRDGDIVYYNNLAANSLYGFSVGGPQYDTHGSVNTRLVNNIVVNNEGYGIIATGATNTFSNVAIDHNLYFNNGWRSYENGGEWKAGDMVVSTRSPSTWTPYPTLPEIQANTAWEDQGVEGDPAFWSFNPSDHDLHDGSWPDLHLTSASITAIDRGVTDLPSSLAALLTEFGVTDRHRGAAYDIGRYEGGFALLAEPTAQAIAPGGSARYNFRLDPIDLPYAITLTIASPSSSLTFTLDPIVLTSSQIAMLTVTDTGALQPGLWYTLPITGSGGGFTQPIGVQLLIGGARVYLPVLLKNSTVLSSQVTNISLTQTASILQNCTDVTEGRLDQVDDYMG